MADKWKKIAKDGYALIVNEGGATLGVGPELEQHLIIQDGFAFKDLNRNGVLDPYEDWRLPMAERIADLASRMSIEEIAGLMLYSAHQSICAAKQIAHQHYAGDGSPDTREHIWDLTAAQKTFLKDDKLRHVLVAKVEDTPTAAKLNNQAQAFVERLGLGIPINISSDPRHLTKSSAEFDMGAGGDISHWPDHIGLAATFDPELVRRFGEIASKEYRAMGITTALSPQIDLATDPRWFRFTGSFGEGVKIAIDMARAYCDGFQTSEGARVISDGWGYDSVNAMVKHWPGGGSGEAGRDAHFGYGKYAVYPGKNFAEHLRPFIEGAFKLAGKTGMASAVMPYYTVSWGIDAKNGENVGNSYSRYLITDLLREKYGYDGVVCTDWLITADAITFDSFFSGKCWGVETLSVAERHYKILMAGVDQFGGNNEKGPVLEAYALGVAEHGEEFMKKRFAQSAKRLLANIFRCGLFENPYLDAEASRTIAGCAEFTRVGYEAQLKSVVMLKNKAVQGRATLPLAAKTRVYLPTRHIDASHDWYGKPTPARDVVPVPAALVREYFELVDDPAQADCAICFIESPKSDGYVAEKGGYLPINLQYRPCIARNAREKNLAGADDRSYRGKTGTTNNERDLDLVLNTKKAMGTKPVIVVAKTSNPFVAAEFESSAAAILLDFCVEAKALFDIISGKAEPSALLPFQMPADMETVEAQCEDVPRDMECHVDESGNRWDFAFGLNWTGVINDERVRKYR
ncbi:MAG: glycoside hydrolase family 3 C-terminal domain-containing protein [Treponema sp.]|jgi:beta-glucosidase|nr:glycoside hydrolase family 3 C-terminal domain-containing protein [Treponema sp.]